MNPILFYFLSKRRDYSMSMLVDVLGIETHFVYMRVCVCFSTYPKSHALSAE